MALTKARAALVNSTLTKCPSTLLNLSGYSQGAQVVHNALSALPPTTTCKISSIVLFGDPENGTALPNIDNNKVYTICHDSDNICADGDSIRLNYSNYSGDAGVAAGFVVNGRGMGMLEISSARVKTSAGGGTG
jgi:predicted esterase